MTCCKCDSGAESQYYGCESRKDGKALWTLSTRSYSAVFNALHVLILMPDLSSNSFFFLVFYFFFKSPTHEWFTLYLSFSTWGKEEVRMRRRRLFFVPGSCIRSHVVCCSVGRNNEATQNSMAAHQTRLKSEIIFFSFDEPLLDHFLLLISLLILMEISLLIIVCPSHLQSHANL